MKQFLILIDNGHGIDTPGKRSPDGRLREWEYTRTLADEIAHGLRSAGIDTKLLVPESKDIPLRERCRRANRECARGRDNVILISLHTNAAGDGSRWMSARGWSVFVAPGASAGSCRLAGCLAEAAEAEGLTVRRPSPGKDFWTANLAICRDTQCVAVLTENMFHDNASDVAFLLSEEGRAKIARLHVEGIKQFINKL